MKTSKRPHKTTLIILTIIAVLALCSCRSGENTDVAKASPYDGQEYIRTADILEDTGDAVIKNFDSFLSVPTYITKIDDTWFIVDCYHNRIIYSDTLGAPLTEWYIMTSNVTQPHTIAGDGKVYLIDDTENNRVLVFEKKESKFVNTQVLNDVGTRPHYTIYDKDTDTFYVWSSKTGELFCLRHTEDSNLMYLTDVRKIPELDGIYVRSFSIISGDIYFVSGVSDSGEKGKLYRCDLETLKIKETYDIPDEIAGMVQITKIQDYYYVTVSTDITGSQEGASILRVRSLEDLSESKYEDIYEKYFVGGGTPYYITNVDDTYFLTEHRLKNHSIWSFKVDNNEITDVISLY